ncbi:dna polymerase eta [Fagus crenata]
MPVAKPESSDARIIAHVDMDCFYVQVEQRKQPNLRGLPSAVVQYNSWKGGSLIAVSYEARKYGVKRSMRGDEAKEVCPQIQLVQVPVARGKADLNTYRSAGSEVVSVLARKGRCERASIDEVYLDLTDAAETMLAETPPESLEVIDEEALKSHVLGLNNEDGSDAKENVREWLCSSDADRRDKLLACGALIVAELRMHVLKETEFTCSAGIAHNKMLAKLASGMHKPAQQTVVPFFSVKGLLESLPIKKMKQLGGKLGTSLQSDLGVNTVGDLLQFSEEKLQECYGINTGTWLWNIARGISGEEVQGRLLPKSHGSGKTFPGPRALKTIASVQHWLNELCEELSERLGSDLDQNKRIAHTLTLHAIAYKFGDSDSHKKFPSKSCPLRYGTVKIQDDALNLFQAGLREFMGTYKSKTQGSQYNGWGITGLSVSASKIVAIPSGTSSIMKYFHGRCPPCSSPEKSQDNFIQDAAPLSPSESESCSGLNLTEPQIVFPGEETEIKHAITSLDQQEDTKKTWKDQDPSCLSAQQTQNGVNQETSPCLQMNLREQQREFPAEEPRIKRAMPSLDCALQKRKTSKDKGTISILSFFKTCDPCSSLRKQEHVEVIQLQDVEAASSVGFQSTSSICSEPNQAELPKESILEQTVTNSGSSTSAHNEQQRESWRYKVDEIDPSVVNELPPEIQEEVQAWLRPHKRPNVVKRGSSIAHYFLPAKNR